MKIRGVIFDYGGVLAFHQREADVEAMARAAGLAVDEFAKRYWRPRTAYDRGDLSAEEYWRRVAAGSDLQRLIELDAGSWTNLDERMYAWAARLRSAGIRTGVLSNMPREIGEHVRAHTAGFAEFDPVTLSYEVRSVKPEESIYRHCLQGLGAKPDETLFLDDRPENIAGAERAGLRGLLFSGFVAFADAVAEFGLPGV